MPDPAGPSAPAGLPDSAGLLDSVGLHDSTSLPDSPRLPGAARAPRTPLTPRRPRARRLLGAGAALVAAAALAGCAGGDRPALEPDAEAMAEFAEYAELRGLDIVLEQSVATATGTRIAADVDRDGPLEFGVHCAGPDPQARLVLEIDGNRFETICDDRAQPGFPLAPTGDGVEFVVEVLESANAEGALTVVVFAPGA